MSGNPADGHEHKLTRTLLGGEVRIGDRHRLNGLSVALGRRGTHASSLFSSRRPPRLPRVLIGCDFPGIDLFLQIGRGRVRFWLNTKLRLHFVHDDLSSLREPRIIGSTARLGLGVGAMQGFVDIGGVRGRRELDTLGRLLNVFSDLVCTVEFQTEQRGKTHRAKKGSD